MHLTPREKDKLLLAVAAMVARRRLERGLRLNHPEAVALIADYVVEGAREGRSVSELMEAAAHLLRPDQVLPGVAEMLESVQVEATFPDGTKLVTVHRPIRPASDGTAEEPSGSVTVPGEVVPAAGEIELNAGREAIELEVRNTGDRPVQVGSHFHFYEVNEALAFDREAAYGMRLDIPAGTAVRFEPGQTRRVRLVPLSGARRVFGFNARVMGSLDPTEG